MCKKKGNGTVNCCDEKAHKKPNKTDQHNSPVGYVLKFPRDTFLGGFPC